MRQLAYLGVAALTAVALLGTSCSSDDNNNGNTNEVGGTAATGGAASTATGGKTSTSTTGTGTKASTGGATSTSTTAAVGGAGVGGVTSTSTGTNAAGGVMNVGGTSATGGAATGGTSAAPLVDGIEVPDNYLQIGDLKGVIWTTADKSDGTGSTITQVKGVTCVNGMAAKIPCPTASTCDYSGVWGVDLGWNLNQTAGVDGGEAGAQNAADLSDVTSITINFDGAPTTKPLMRIQLEVKDADAGTSKYYCSGIATSALPQTLDIRSLKTSCWPGAKPTEQEAFDPMTMQPVSLAIQVVTETGSAYPYNFCLTELKFNTDQ